MTTEPSSPETIDKTLKCPDCQKEYTRPKPGKYRCVNCFCKFSLNKDYSMKIIPFYDEMKLGPILIMLFVLGIILLVAMGDKYYSFNQRLNFFVIFSVITVGMFKLIQFLCRRYRGVDRVFRRGTRLWYRHEDSSLIELDYDKLNE